MYCPNCGAKQNQNEKFCAKCGKQVITDSAPKENQTTQTSKKNSGIFYMFNISGEELNRQITNYESLSITESSRGIAALTIIGLLVFSTILIVVLNQFLSDTTISYFDVLGSLVLYVPLIYFVYRGHLWAIIALALYYTVDKLYTSIIFSPTHFNIGAIIFWMIGIGPLWIAFRVERAYRKKKMLGAVS